MSLEDSLKLHEAFQKLNEKRVDQKEDLIEKIKRYEKKLDDSIKKLEYYEMMYEASESYEKSYLREVNIFCKLINENNNYNNMFLIKESPIGDFFTDTANTMDEIGAWWDENVIGSVYNFTDLTALIEGIGNIFDSLIQYFGRDIPAEEIELLNVSNEIDRQYKSFMYSLPEEDKNELMTDAAIIQTEINLAAWGAILKRVTWPPAEVIRIVAQGSFTLFTLPLYVFRLGRAIDQHEFIEAFFAAADVITTLMTVNEFIPWFSRFTDGISAARAGFKAGIAALKKILYTIKGVGDLILWIMKKSPWVAGGIFAAGAFYGHPLVTAGMVAVLYGYKIDKVLIRHLEKGNLSKQLDIAKTVKDKRLADIVEPDYRRTKEYMNKLDINKIDQKAAFDEAKAAVEMMEKEIKKNRTAFIAIEKLIKNAIETAKANEANYNKFFPNYSGGLTSSIVEALESINESLEVLILDRYINPDHFKHLGRDNLHAISNDDTMKVFKEKYPSFYNALIAFGRKDFDDELMKQETKGFLACIALINNQGASNKSSEFFDIQLGKMEVLNDLSRNSKIGVDGKATKWTLGDIGLRIKELDKLVVSQINITLNATISEEQMKLVEKYMKDPMDGKIPNSPGQWEFAFQRVAYNTTVPERERKMINDLREQIFKNYMNIIEGMTEGMEFAKFIKNMENSIIEAILDDMPKAVPQTVRKVMNLKINPAAYEKIAARGYSLSDSSILLLSAATHTVGTLYKASIQNIYQIVDKFKSVLVDAYSTLRYDTPEYIKSRVDNLGLEEYIQLGD